MNSSQKSLIEKYISLYGKKTLQKMAQETGIQVTRLFRIMNGAELKFKESEIFQELIQRKTYTPQNNVTQEFEKIFTDLDQESYREFQDYLETFKRNLSIKKQLRSVANGHSSYLH